MLFKGEKMLCVCTHLRSCTMHPLSSPLSIFKTVITVIVLDIDTWHCCIIKLIFKHHVYFLIFCAFHIAIFYCKIKYRLDVYLIWVTDILTFFIYWTNMEKLYLFNVYTFGKSQYLINVGSPYGLPCGPHIYFIFI